MLGRVFGSWVTNQLNEKRYTITIIGDDEASSKSELLAFSASLCGAPTDVVVRKPQERSGDDIGGDRHGEISISHATAPV